MSGHDEKVVYLPLEAHVHGAAAALHGLGKVRQFTVGGNISILTGFVLAAFPMLYEAPNRPFDPYVHPNRGMRNSQGILLPWSEDNPVLSTEAIDKIIKGALALLCHVIRKPQQNPMSQLTRRFNALYATVCPGLQPPTVDLDPSLDYKKAAARLSYEETDIAILKFLLYAEDYEEMGPAGKAFITQLRLVATSAEMTPYLTI